MTSFVAIPSTHAAMLTPTSFAGAVPSGAGSSARTRQPLSPRCVGYRPANERVEREQIEEPHQRFRALHRVRDRLGQQRMQ